MLSSVVGGQLNGSELAIPRAPLAVTRTGTARSCTYQSRMSMWWLER